MVGLDYKLQLADRFKLHTLRVLMRSPDLLPAVFTGDSSLNIWISGLSHAPLDAKGADRGVARDDQAGSPEEDHSQRRDHRDPGPTCCLTTYPRGEAGRVEEEEGGEGRQEEAKGEEDQEELGDRLSNTL